MTFQSSTQKKSLCQRHEPQTFTLRAEQGTLPQMTIFNGKAVRENV